MSNKSFILITSQPQPCSGVNAASIATLEMFKGIMQLEKVNVALINFRETKDLKTSPSNYAYLSKDEFDNFTFIPNNFINFWRSFSRTIEQCVKRITVDVVPAENFMKDDNCYSQQDILDYIQDNRKSNIYFECPDKIAKQFTPLIRNPNVWYVKIKKDWKTGGETYLSVSIFYKFRKTLKSVYDSGNIFGPPPSDSFNS